MLRKDLCCFSEPLENHGKSKKGNLLLQIALHFRGDDRRVVELFGGGYAKAESTNKDTDH
jgi:hypothetical protein